MVQLKVGDTVAICASLSEFCGASYQVYNIADINISLPPCSINIFPSSFPDCIANPLNPSGVQLEFYWINTAPSTEVHNCVDSIKLGLPIGSGYTDSDAKVVITYIITQNDLDLFNNNSANFDLMVCIKNKTDAEVVNLGEARKNISYHTGDSISIVTELEATDYIEYDFSFLPGSFLDLVSEHIVTISNGIGKYLPSPTNIIYKHSTFDGGKFRVYVVYFPPVSLHGLHGISDLHNNVYNADTYNIYKSLYEQTNKQTTNEQIPFNIVSMIELSLDTYARLVSALVIFATCQMLLAEIIGFGTLTSIILAAVGAVIVDWGIHNISLDTTATGTTNIPPNQQIELIREFANKIRNRCNLEHTGCGDVPPTCGTVDMQSYNKCIGAVDIEQYINDEKQSGTLDQNEVDNLITKVNNIDECLEGNSCTVEQAKTDIDNRSNDVNTNSITKQELTTCSIGYVYNPDMRICILAEDCAIRNPFGGCILKKSTLSKAVTIGVILTGAYIAYKIIRKK